MPNKIRFLTPLITLLLLAGMVGFAAAQGSAPLAPQEMAGASFTYQGQLQHNSAPYTGTCNFQFSLWDAATAGNRIGSLQTIENQSVNQGLFSALLNAGGEFGSSAFNGEARWLQVGVNCPGDSAYTTLSPRQAITGTPFALSLIHGSRILPAGSSFGLHVSNNPVSSGAANPIAISASVNETDFLPGAVGYGDLPIAVRGFAQNGHGVVGITAAQDGAAGVMGTANSGIGVLGTTNNGTGVYGKATNYISSAILAENTAGGRAASFLGDILVDGDSGFYGDSFFYGNSPCCFGSTLEVQNSSSGTALWAITEGANAGVFAQGGGSGVVGEATANGGIGVVGRLSVGVSGLAGAFIGNVDVTGSILAPVISMQIDHPLNPAGMYLNQAYVASPEMTSQYSGNVVTDADGFAVVRLPDYVQTLNSDFRYNLTVIGQFARAIVSAKIQDGQFTIQTDLPNVEVSWLVIGVRQDPYAVTYPVVAEEVKPQELQGVYKNPELYGFGPEQGVGYDFRQQQLESPEAHELLEGAPE